MLHMLHAFSHCSCNERRAVGDLCERDPPQRLATATVDIRSCDDHARAGEQDAFCLSREPRQLTQVHGGEGLDGEHERRLPWPMRGRLQSCRLHQRCRPRQSSIKIVRNNQAVAQ